MEPAARLSTEACGASRQRRPTSAISPPPTSAAKPMMM
jgi:hypothetical protein